MHTEHLQSVRVPRVLTGWLVAIATTSLIVLALAGLGVLGLDVATDNLWAVVAVAVGFWIGGLFIGFRAVDAPILHGIAIGITSLVAWFLVNLGMVVAFPHLTWQGLSPALTAALMLLQMAAAVGGAWFGRRVAARGAVGVGEGV